jgi:hypothetical protein
VGQDEEEIVGQGDQITALGNNIYSLTIPIRPKILRIAQIRYPASQLYVLSQLVKEVISKVERLITTCCGTNEFNSVSTVNFTKSLPSLLEVCPPVLRCTIYWPP